MATEDGRGGGDLSAGATTDRRVGAGAGGRSPLRVRRVTKGVIWPEPVLVLPSCLASFMKDTHPEHTAEMARAYLRDRHLVYSALRLGHSRVYVLVAATRGSGSSKVLYLGPQSSSESKGFLVNPDG